MVKDFNDKKIMDSYWEKHQWTKNQHYVPQFYLKYFSNEEWKVETLDIKNKRIMKPQSISHICSADYFYSIKTWEKDKISQLLEDFFTEVENIFAQKYDKIIENLSNYNEKIDKRLLFCLCEFVIISYFRSKHFRETLEAMSENTMKGMMQRLTKHKALDINNEELEKKLENKDYNVNFDNSSHIKFMLEHIEEFTYYLFNKKITIYITDGERNFVTSDCCVNEVIPEIKGPFWIWFLERYHYFAISPKILIEFRSPELPGKARKRKRIWKWDVIFFNYFNSRQWNYLYAKSKADINIKEHITAHFKYIDVLYKLYPTRYKIDKKLKEQIVATAMKEWLSKADAEDYYCAFAIKRWWFTKYFKTNEE